MSQVVGGQVNDRLVRTGIVFAVRFQTPLPFRTRRVGTSRYENAFLQTVLRACSPLSIEIW